MCQVSCGASHTLAISDDGRTIWSFGAGDHGKLGHGEIARLYRPKVIEALQGISIVKVQAGNQVSLALTAEGQVRVDKASILYLHNLSSMW